MANDIFIQISGIQGESKDAMYPGAIEVLSWNWRVHQDARYLSGSGARASKASVSDLSFIHHIDRSSPNLSTFCFHGKHIDEVSLIMRKAGGLPFEYLRLTLNDVVITDVSPAGGESMAIETVSLSFTKMRQQYFPQSSTGAGMGAVTGVIDLRQFVDR